MIVVLINKGVKYMFLCASETIDDARYECHRFARIRGSTSKDASWWRSDTELPWFGVSNGGCFYFIELDELKSRKQRDGKVFLKKNIYDDELFYELNFCSFLPPPALLLEMMVPFVPKEGELEDESELEDRLRRYAMDRRMREETGERPRPLKTIFEQRHYKDVNT